MKFKCYKESVFFNTLDLDITYAFEIILKKSWLRNKLILKYYFNMYKRKKKQGMELSNMRKALLWNDCDCWGHAL